MRKFLAIAHNTFLQTIRQPIYCILILAMFLVLVLTLPMSSWTLGTGEGNHHDTDQKMLEIAGLSTLLIGGVLLAAFSASSALAREIEDHTALTVISKPVPRSVFVLGKFAGVAAATALAYYLGSLVFLMTVRHQVMSSVSEPYDWPVIVLGCSGLAAALLVALSGNYFFNWTFTSSFVWSATVCLSLAMAVILFVGKDWQPVPPGYDERPKAYDNLAVYLRPGTDANAFRAFALEQKFTIVRSVDQQRLVYLRAPEGQEGSEKLDPDQAVVRIRKGEEWKARGVESVDRQVDPPVLRPALLVGVGLTFLSLLVLVAVAVASSTRLGLVLTLLVCGAVFLVGSYHRAVFLNAQGDLALRGLAWLVPNLGYFYTVDVLSKSYETGIPMGYVGAVALYCVLYLGAVLSLGVVLFQGRQMAAEEGSASVPGAVNLLAGVGRAVAVVLAAVAVRYLLLFLPAGQWAPSLLMGALLLVAALNWVIWSAFGRGRAWVYWLVTVSVCLDIVRLIVGRLWPQALPQRLLPEAQDPALAVFQAATLTVILLILLMPKTRRHFRSQTRS